MRWLKRLVIGLAAVIVLLVVLLFVAYMYIDSIARKGVEVGGKYALGVPTTLDKASVGIFQGHVGLTGLMVANPQGYTAPHFLKLNQGNVDVKLSSLMGDTADVPMLELSGFDVNLEKRNGKANYQVIMDNLKSLESKQQAQPAQPAKPGKKFVIHDLKLTGIVVHADMVGAGGPLDVTVDPIELKEVGTAAGADMHMEDLAGIIMKAILAAVANKALEMPGQLAKSLGSDLGSGLSGLKSLGSSGIQVVGDVGGKLGNLGLQAGQKIGDVGKSIGEGVSGLGKGLGGLFGGSSDSGTSGQKK